MSAWLKGEVAIADKIDAARAVFFPIVALGELYYGASFSTQVEKNYADIKKVLKQYPILTLDGETTSIYGSIKSNLRKKGKPIPENDIWIAAIAIQNDLPLVTRDAHFKEIEEILTLTW